MPSVETMSVERDIEQAITALKKGAYLLKYGRRGKPKFCPFRLSNDESVLIWYSGKEEKHLKLSHVSRIMPGQRTAIFQRHPRPEKECQSFSLIYSDRSLDLICKDKDEAEVWFAGLRALISHSHQRKWKGDSRNDGISSGMNSPRTYTRSSPLSSPFGTDAINKDGSDLYLRSPHDSPPKNGSDRKLSDILYSVPRKGFFPSDSASTSIYSFSSGASDSNNGPMRGPQVDNCRVSLSSAVSSSSQGSGQDDGDALGDVFIWGEGTGEGILGGGSQRLQNSSAAKTDSLVPKALESAVILDAQYIACGGRHAALVTKQGEIYSWGEGHGVDFNVSHPKLVDTLSNQNVELVACGECHTCAVTLSGDLYTWGDGKNNFGLLGHGNRVSHWVPKRINGPLEGLHVSSIGCGPWHTAVVTSSGQLFTFGDGSFGVLGHGDWKSISIPREVESLKGLRTVRVACGVWHTAAVVEVMAGNSSMNNYSSGKLFTWGDGDKGQLGHGDKESRLVPTCVAALVEPNFCQVACGNSLTVALTTSGHVYTMGSAVYGQLGHPQTDGKLPVRVEDKLAKSFVEEIACGAYHVAVLTSRTEVYTWGKGANGRLGHGDADDRYTPTLVEALKDKQVRSIACGTNFTAAICIHKWISGVDQSLCSGCRLPFNFKRKRHNCYNCALLFCHSCSSRKSLKASMAPNPKKPFRVCDGCYNKLTKNSESDSFSQTAGNRKGNKNQITIDFVDDAKWDSSSHIQISRVSSIESLKQLESKSLKRNKKLDFSTQVSPMPNMSSHWNALGITKTLNPVSVSSKKAFSASVPGSRVVSRATSPTSRRPSPPRATTPTPTLSGLMTPKFTINDALKNDNLRKEVLQLRSQVEHLSGKIQLQEIDLERITKQLKETVAIAGEESAKCKAAKEVIKSLTAQLKEMAETLPVGVLKSSKLPFLASLDTDIVSSDASSMATDQLSSISTNDSDITSSNGLLISDGQKSDKCSGSVQSHVIRNGSKQTIVDSNHEITEWVEQDEPGVYITLTSLPGGSKDLKRVRFSRKRFSQKQAEKWWAENRTRVYKLYNVRMVDKSSVDIPNGSASHSNGHSHNL